MALSVALVTGVALWWWLRPGGPSKVAGFLPREGVTAVLFIDEPPGLLRALEGRFVAKESGSFDLNEAIKALKFDPRLSADWQGIGIDEDKGIAAVLFQRTGAAPIILVDVEKPMLFRLWLASVLDVAELSIPEPVDGVSIVQVGRTRLLMGRVGPFTAIMRGGPGIDADFRAFLTAKGRLITEPRIRDLFEATERRPRLVAFAQTAQMAQGETSQFLSMLVTAAPTVSGFIDETDGAVWIAISEDGRARLTRYTTAVGEAPRFSRVLPAKGWSALRLSLNLDAVMQLLDVYTSFGAEQLRKSGWWSILEATRAVYDQVGPLLSGHLVLAMPNESLGEWLAQPDRVAPRWVVMAGLKPGANLPKTDLAAPARQMGNIAVFAPTDVVLNRLQPLAESAVPTQHTLLDRRILFGLTVETSDLLDALGSAVPQSVFDLLKSTELANKPRLAMGFSLETMGLVSRGDAGPLFATAGVAGLIVAPELAQRRRVRQQAEARRFVARMAEGALTAWQRRIPGIDGSAQPPRFPPAAGPTPSPSPSRFCDGYPAQPAQWDAPGWRGLNFSIHGPHRYQYTFEVNETGFTARAVGDLDCDAALSTYEVIGTVQAGDVVLRSVSKAPFE